MPSGVTNVWMALSEAALAGPVSVATSDPFAEAPNGFTVGKSVPPKTERLSSMLEGAWPVSLTPVSNTWAASFDDIGRVTPGVWLLLLTSTRADWA